MSKTLEYPGLSSQFLQTRESPRELNSDLFGPQSIPTGTDSIKLNPLSPLENSLLELKKEVQVIKDQQTQLIKQVNEALSRLHQKVESSHQLGQKAEADRDLLKLELAQKFHQVQVKLTDYSSIEDKVQDMMDRHNTVIKSFEVRIHQLQKLVAEKDAQVSAAQAALNATIMDLAKMRRD